jgi:hypothetical protein
MEEGLSVGTQKVMTAATLSTMNAPGLGNRAMGVERLRVYSSSLPGG